MVKRRGPPSQGWRTFLCNHAPDIAAMDLFFVPTIGFDLLYAFVIKVHKIEEIKYFSAYATWKPKQHERHQIYMKALQSTGVKPIMGNSRKRIFTAQSADLLTRDMRKRNQT
jgi:hypothetical protein